MGLDSFGWVLRRVNGHAAIKPKFRSNRVRYVFLHRTFLLLNEWFKSQKNYNSSVINFRTAALSASQVELSVYNFISLLSRTEKDLMIRCLENNMRVLTGTKLSHKILLFLVFWTSRIASADPAPPANPWQQTFLCLLMIFLLI